MEAVGADLDQQVDIRVEDGRIVIEPIRHGYDLASLVAAINDANRHAPIETGEAVGNEAW